MANHVSCGHQNLTQDYLIMINWISDHQHPMAIVWACQIRLDKG